MSLTDIPPQPERPRRSFLEAVLPYTTVALILVALYVGWIFYSRHASAQQAAQDAANKKQQALKRDSDLVFGNGEISFTTFSADTGVLHPGQTTQLCYGVVNATTIKLDPPVEPIKPMFRHCIDIAPKHTTTYTLTAGNAKGESKSLSLTIQVK